MRSTELVKASRMPGTREKLGIFANVCRAQKQVNQITEEPQASRAEEDDWEPHTIHLVRQTVNSTTKERKDRKSNFTARILLNNRHFYI